MLVFLLFTKIKPSTLQLLLLSALSNFELHCVRGSHSLRANRISTLFQSIGYWLLHLVLFNLLTATNCSKENIFDEFSKGLLDIMYSCCEKHYEYVVFLHSRKHCNGSLLFWEPRTIQEDHEINCKIFVAPRAETILPRISIWLSTPLSQSLGADVDLCYFWNSAVPAVLGDMCAKLLITGHHWSHIEKPCLSDFREMHSSCIVVLNQNWVRTQLVEIMFATISWTHLYLRILLLSCIL